MSEAITPEAFKAIAAQYGEAAGPALTLESVRYTLAAQGSVPGIAHVSRLDVAAARSLLFDATTSALLSGSRADALKALKKGDAQVLYRLLCAANAILCGEVLEYRPPTADEARKMGSAGAAPNPLFDDQERAAFEAWMAGHGWGIGEVAQDGSYVARITRMLWATWRDRAALARNPKPRTVDQVLKDAMP